MEQAQKTNDVANSSVEIGGKTYTIRITDYDARKLKGLGFHVYDFHESDSTVTALFGPSPIFADVLLHFCKPEDEEAFLQSLDGDVMEAARAAVRNAIQNFFPASSRANVLLVYEKIREAMTKAMAEALND